MRIGARDYVQWRATFIVADQKVSEAEATLVMVLSYASCLVGVGKERRESSRDLDNILDQSQICHHESGEADCMSVYLFPSATISSALVVLLPAPAV